LSADLKALLVQETDLPQRVGQFDILLEDATRMAEALVPQVEQFLAHHRLEKVPASLQPHVREEASRLTYWGLITHFLLFNSPYRSRARELDLSQLSSEWVVRTVTCLSTMSSYNKDNGGYPELIFRIRYSRTLEPLQKRLNLRWWRRFRNEPKFRHFFASGLVLGMLVDMRAKQLSEKGSGP